MCQIRAGRICVRVGGTVSNTLKGCGTEKKGRETKILKRGQGPRDGCLKKGGWKPLTNYDLQLVERKKLSQTDSFVILQFLASLQKYMSAKFFKICHWGKLMSTKFFEIGYLQNFKCCKKF